MAISQPYSSGAITFSTTEISLVSGTSTLQTSTTAGIYEAMLDLSALASGDAFEIRVKEKVVAGGTQNVISKTVVAGPLSDSPVYVSPSMILMNGWDITIIKVDGTDRIIPYSIRQVA